MSNYVKEWCFTEKGNAYNLLKICAIVDYSREKENKMIVVLNKEQFLIDTSEGKEIIKALKQREIDIEEHITGRLKEMMEGCK